MRKGDDLFGPVGPRISESGALLAVPEGLG